MDETVRVNLLAGMLIVGTGYLTALEYFLKPFERYRKASPDERASRGWGDGVFVLRAPFADELKTGWAKRVDRIARIALPAVFILALTLIIAYGLFAG